MVFLLVEGKIVSLLGDGGPTYFCYLLLCVPQSILSLATYNKHDVKKNIRFFSSFKNVIESSTTCKFLGRTMYFKMYGLHSYYI